MGIFDTGADQLTPAGRASPTPVPRRRARARRPQERGLEADRLDGGAADDGGEERAPEADAGLEADRGGSHPRSDRFLDVGEREPERERDGERRD